VRTENVEIPRGAPSPPKDGTYIRITFADDGIGIPAENLNKVFDPYFSTKEMGTRKGMGLGLSVCYSVIKKHEGYIGLDSWPGKGTTVSIYLPARKAVVADPGRRQVTPQAGAAAGGAGRSLRVLVMDDDSSIREIERSYLEQLGHKVTEAGDGREAIDAYTRELHGGSPFDFVILDLTVRQGWGGRETMKRLLEIDPEVRAVIVSGYIDDPVILSFGDYGFLGALKKPFKGEELQELMEKIFPRES
jgi:CheY-like chemotaxis protein